MSAAWVLRAAACCARCWERWCCIENVYERYEGETYVYGLGSRQRALSLKEGKDTNWAPLALFSGPCLA